MLTIFGKGFGIYGYLPALIKLGHSVCLPRSYKETLQSRPDVSFCSDSVRWLDNHDDCLSLATGAVIATDPISQYELVKKMVKIDRLKFFLLEKPLSYNPESSLEILRLLNERAVNDKFFFGINYSFLHTQWAGLLDGLLGKSGESFVRIEWKFKAYYFNENIDSWKRHHELGGGILRFYGIHIIALLAQLNFSNVIESAFYARRNQAVTKWFMRCCNKAGREIQVLVNINADENTFRIADGDEIVVESDDPFFDPSVERNLDRRVPYIVDYVNSLKESCVTGDFHLRVIKLWKEIEHVSSYSYDVISGKAF